MLSKQNKVIIKKKTRELTQIYLVIKSLYRGEVFNLNYMITYWVVGKIVLSGDGESSEVFENVLTLSTYYLIYFSINNKVDWTNFRQICCI